MRKMVLIIGVIIIILTGCAKDLNPFNGHTIIDWVDFVKMNGHSYERLYNGVIADPDLVTSEVVGTIDFKLEQNVNNPGYKTKDGDAAFLAKGTKLYAIKGLSQEKYLAVQDNSMINKYKVYYNRGEESGKTWHFSDLDQQNLEEVEIYAGYTGIQLQNKLEVEQLSEFMQLLNASVEISDYRSVTINGDPQAYRIVFYDGNPIAQLHRVYKDDLNYYWHPRDTSIIDLEVVRFLSGN